MVAATASTITGSDGGDRCRSRRHCWGGGGRRCCRCWVILVVAPAVLVSGDGGSRCCRWGWWWLPPLVMVMLSSSSIPRVGVVFAIVENAGVLLNDGAGSKVVAEAVDVVRGRTSHDRMMVHCQLPCLCKVLCRSADDRSLVLEMQTPEF